MKLFIAGLAGTLLSVAAAAAAEDPNSLDRLLERVVAQEQRFVQNLSTRTPLVETYIQETGDAATRTRTPQDHYFLGRLGLSGGTLNYTQMAFRSDTPKNTHTSYLKNRSIVFVPAGFAQMVFMDLNGFDRARYTFEYVRREFLGDIRCLVLDVTPTNREEEGRFFGRIWVEDGDFNIVRFNGTYTKPTSRRLYFHFDSWRINIEPKLWVPLCTYVEESTTPGDLKAVSGSSFKGQTRLWGYNTGKSARMDELTKFLIELNALVKDKEAAVDASPLESQRSWERQAEENILDRLVKSGLIAPKGPVDDVLNTVVNNLIVTNTLTVEATVRILMTTPLETFTVGHTIVVSRGLIDVLPDESSLAMVLGGELAHIALGHRTNTQFAFNNQTMVSDEELLSRFRFARTPAEIASAGRKAVEILGNSPYKEKLANAGLFLKALASRAAEFPNLIRANIGNQLAGGDNLVRLGELAKGAPQLENDKLEQIAALPLGSRIKVNPWLNTITMMKARPVSLLSPREKLSFEVTPFLLHLTRAETPPAEKLQQP